MVLMVTIAMQRSSKWTKKGVLYLLKVRNLPHKGRMASNPGPQHFISVLSQQQIGPQQQTSVLNSRHLPSLNSGHLFKCRRKR